MYAITLYDPEEQKTLKSEQESLQKALCYVLAIQELERPSGVE